MFFSFWNLQKCVTTWRHYWCSSLLGINQIGTSPRFPRIFRKLKMFNFSHCCWPNLVKRKVFSEWLFFSLSIVFLSSTSLQFSGFVLMILWFCGKAMFVGDIFVLSWVVFGQNVRRTTRLFVTFSFKLGNFSSTRFCAQIFLCFCQNIFCCLAWWKLTSPTLILFSFFL